MFCAKCGKQIPDGSAVCPFCGAPMAAPQAPQAAPVAPQAPQAAPVAPQTGYAVPPVAPVYAPVAPQEKKPVNKLPIIIGAIAAAAVLAIVLYLILHDGAKSLVKDYIKYSEAQEENESKYFAFKNEGIFFNNRGVYMSTFVNVNSGLFNFIYICTAFNSEII